MDEAVGVAVPVGTEKQKAFALLVTAAVGVQNCADLTYDVGCLHGAGGVHTPGETERAGFPVFSIFPFIFLLIPRYMATAGWEWKEREAGLRQRMRRTFLVLRLLIHGDLITMVVKNQCSSCMHGLSSHMGINAQQTRACTQAALFNAM